MRSGAVLLALALSACRPSYVHHVFYTGEDFYTPDGRLDVRRDQERGRLIVSSPKHGYEVGLPYADFWEFHVITYDPPGFESEGDGPDGQAVLWARSGKAPFVLKILLRRPGYTIEPESYLREEILGRYTNSEFEETRRESTECRMEKSGDVPVAIRPWSLGIKYVSCFGAVQRKDGVVCLLHLWSHNDPENADACAAMKETIGRHFRVTR